MKATIRENRDRRDLVFDQILAESPRSGFAHQHHIWPCVRRGAGETWLRERGMLPKPSRRTILYFLRGKSVESLLRNENMPPVMLIYDTGNGKLALRPDQWTGQPERPFEEIKSTNLSSFPFWALQKKGTIDMADPNLPGRNYFEQCAFYCVATGSSGCYLTIYFLHGDYGERRKNCPNCKNALGPLQEERFKECPNCGYKSKTSDLWSYEVDFTPETLEHFKREMLVRTPEYYAAVKAETPAELLDFAPATPGYMCQGCEIGEQIGCTHAGKQYG